MHESIVVRKLKKREPILSVKVNFKSPAIVEMMGMMGFDCLWICNEHIYHDDSTIDHMTLAARAGGMDTMLRRNMSGYEQALLPLEMGVNGFMVPRVTSVDYIKRVVDYVKFPPKGRRGLDGVNADSDFGLIPLDEYLKRSNEQTFIIAQIEDEEAVDLVDDIAAVEGVDILFVGPADLSVSLGVPGQLQHEKVSKVLAQVGEACEKHGKCAGTPAISPEYSESLRGKGYRFFTAGGDYGFVKKGLQSLIETYSALGYSFRDSGR